MLFFGHFLEEVQKILTVERTMPQNSSGGEAREPGRARMVVYDDAWNAPLAQATYNTQRFEVAAKHNNSWSFWLLWHGYSPSTSMQNTWHGVQFVEQELWTLIRNDIKGQMCNQQ